ncbi:zinc ABC transporter substrate-binding protein [uncultured Tateyamaria sp.]|uniref:zinc ABC transporter substrate-binding protein n=1 Tax=uncultured Tateyamaria sp. TaxID=455651 RepID=UPI002620BD79|nr:zinc ABC transporter substrate-binding protein [uncultured Tateyamaria sp.]
MMRTLLPTTLAVLLGTTALADAPRVAVDIAPVHSIVAAVMEGVGTPDLIVPTGASPHDHSLRPSEARALDEAELIVWVGHGLTPWLEGPLDSLGEGAEKIELLKLPATRLMELREGATFAAHDHGHGEEEHDDHDHEDHDDDKHDDHGDEHASHDEHADHDEHAHDDHAHEDEHAHSEHKHDDHEEASHDEAGHDGHGHAHADGVDPHAWLDPQNAVIWAAAIAEELGHLDPDNAQAYANNAAAFGSEIKALTAELEQELQPVSDKPFIVFHDAYQYFEARFGVAAVGAVSASDAEDPSPRRLAELREEIEALDAVCALTEPQFNPGIINALGDVRVGEIDPIGVSVEPGPDLYATLVRNMATSLAACLK